MAMSRNNPNIVNEPPAGFKASLRSRVIVAIILIAIMAPALVLGSWVFLAIVGAFLCLAVVEVVKAPGKKYGWWVWVLTYIIVISLTYWFLLKSNLIGLGSDKDNYHFSLENYFGTFNVSVIGIAASLLIYFLIAIFDKNFDFSDVSYFFTFTILLSIGFQSFYFLRYFPFFEIHSGTEWNITLNGKSGQSLLNEPLFQFLLSGALIVYMILGVYLNDAFAYFGGIFFGKKKMNERISPKKTWAGFWFGVIGSFAVTSAFALILAATGYPMLPFFDLEHWYWILLCSLILPLLANVGDLSLSLIKRHFQIKDYSNILRGHGGILDRVDSLLFGAAGLSIFIILISHQWNFLA